MDGPVRYCLTQQECTEAAGYYVDHARKRCITEAACQEYGYTFEGDEQLCLTAKQCESRDGYLVNEEFRKCVSTDICQEYVLADDTCVSGPECKRGRGYLYNDSFPKRCLTSSECTSIEKYYVDNAKRSCVQRATCATYGYVFGEGSSKECLTSEAQCLEKDGYHIERHSQSCVRE